MSQFLGSLVVYRQRDAIRGLDRYRPHVGPLPRYLGGYLGTNRHYVFEQFRRGHGGVPGPNGEARSGTQVHVRRLKAPLYGERQRLLPRKSHGYGLLLLVEELGPEGLREHGHYPVVGEEDVEPTEQQSTLVVGLVLDAEGLKRQDLLDAAEVGGEASYHLLNPLLRRVLDDDACLDVA